MEYSPCTLFFLVVALRVWAASSATFPGADVFNSSNRTFWSNPILVFESSASFGSLALRAPSLTAPRGEVLLTAYNAPPNTSGYVSVFPLDIFVGSPPTNVTLNQGRNLVLGEDFPACSKADFDTREFPFKYDTHPISATFLRSRGGDIAFADTVPHMAIVRINRTTAVPNNGTMSLLAGLNLQCNFNQTSVHNNTNVSKHDWDWTYGIAEDPFVDGCLYVSHSFVVGRLAPDGNYTYYFGNSTPGTFADDFNNMTPRWNATTDSPTQISIDSDTRMMYIAEAGMRTIRSVNMTSGMATIVAGKLNCAADDALNCTFPPKNCFLDNCRATDLELIYPSSVAIHKSTAYNETWMFVGDYTAAVVYRIVLETGASTIIAGEMFHYRGNLAAPTRHAIIVYFNVTNGRGALFLTTMRGVQRIDWSEPLDTPSPAPSGPTAEEVAVAVSAGTVVVSAVLGGVAVTEATTLLTVGSVKCRNSASRKKSVMQQIFYFLASNGNDTVPSTGASWGMLTIVLVCIIGHVGTAAFVFHRLPDETKAKHDAWQTVCADLRCPSLSWIVADALFPLALFNAMEAASTPGQTAGEVVSGMIVLITVIGLFVGTRWYATSHVTPGADFIERVENPMDTATFGRMYRESDEGEAMATIPADTQGRNSPIAMMPARHESTASFASLTSSFASLLGIPSQHRRQSPQQEVLQASFTAYAAGEMGSPVNQELSARQDSPMSPLHDTQEDYGAYSPPRWVSLVAPYGYWAPEDEAKRWNAAFAKMGEHYRDQRWCESALPLLSGVVSGYASGLYNQPACQPIMCVLAAIFLLAAFVVVWIQPYRTPTEHIVFIPVSFVILAVIAIANAVGDQFPSDAVAALQFLQVVLAVIKSVLHLLVMLYDGPVQYKHLQGRQRKTVITLTRADTDDALDIDPLSQVVASPAGTTDDGSVGWSRQQTSNLINDSFLMGLKHTGRANTGSLLGSRVQSIELFADPSAVAAGRAVRAATSPLVAVTSPPPALVELSQPTTEDSKPANMVRVTSVDRVSESSDVEL